MTSVTACVPFEPCIRPASSRHGKRLASTINVRNTNALEVCAVMCMPDYCCVRARALTIKCIIIMFAQCENTAHADEHSVHPKNWVSRRWFRPELAYKLQCVSAYSCAQYVRIFLLANIIGTGDPRTHAHTHTHPHAPLARAFSNNNNNNKRNKTHRQTRAKLFRILMRSTHVRV